MAEAADALEVTPVGAAGRPVIANLLQLYLHEMASWFGAALDAAGRYDHDILEEAWESPYLFSLDGAPVGFTLLTRHCTIRPRSPCWYVAEFCVLGPWQRRGLGRRAMEVLLARHPGAWEITWFDGNPKACAFWPRVIPAGPQEQHRLHVDGLDWTSVAFAA